MLVLMSLVLVICAIEAIIHYMVCSWVVIILALVTAFQHVFYIDMSILLLIQTLTILVMCFKGPDHELFPAQEAVLPIQTCIVDLILDKDNFVTTRIVVPSSDIECLNGKHASQSKIGRLIGVNIQIIPREELPPCVAETDEVIQVCWPTNSSNILLDSFNINDVEKIHIASKMPKNKGMIFRFHFLTFFLFLQIKGEIKAARETVLKVTERLRKYLFNDFYQRDTNLPTAPLPVVETSSNIKAPVDEVYSGTETSSTHQNLHNVAATLPSKVIIVLQFG